MNDFHQMSVEETLAWLQTDPRTGLDQKAVHQRQSTCGANEIPGFTARSPWKILSSQLAEGTVLALVLAAILATVYVSISISAIIILFIAIFAGIGFYQEYRNDRDLSRPQHFGQVYEAVVRRDGRLQVVRARDLVPGDIVILEDGLPVPADGRVILSADLQLDESALVGSSAAKEKSTFATSGQEALGIGEQSNMALLGTMVIRGRGEMVVTATGHQTQVGQIAATLSEIELTRIPIQERLKTFGDRFSVLAIILAAIIFVVGLLRGSPLDDNTVVSFTVLLAGVPQAMPALTIIALLTGMRYLRRRNIRVRRLSALETLGAVNVIVCEKSGVMTRNETVIAEIALPGMDEPTLTSLQPGRGIPNEVETLKPIDPSNLWAVIGFFRAIATSSGAFGPAVTGSGENEALYRLMQKLGVTEPYVKQELPRIAELPSTRDREIVSSLHRVEGQVPGDLFSSPYVVISRGNPRQMLELSTHEVLPEGLSRLTNERIETWHAKIDEMMSERGLTVQAVGFCPLQRIPNDITPQTIQRDLYLQGLIGYLDPILPEARTAIKIANQAGVRVLLTTGDDPLAATTIARELGIMGSDDRPLTGEVLDRLSSDQFNAIALKVPVYVRLSPLQKAHLVKTFQSYGYVVAATGDSVYDVPAVSQADIGVAPTLTGTDICRSVAEIEVMDHPFASLVATIEGGRHIYDNIYKVVRYFFTYTASVLLVIIGAVLIGLELPILPVHVLWLNMFVLPLTALGLIFEPEEPNIMKRKPRPPTWGLFAPGAGLTVAWTSVWISAVTMMSFLWALNRHGGTIVDPTEQSLVVARTMVFSVFTLSQVYFVSAIHAGDTSFLTSPLWRNKPLLRVLLIVGVLQMILVYIPFAQALLDTLGPDFAELVFAWLLAGSVLPATETYKYFHRRRTRL
jgi:Ca2+-transporting ATPase